MITAVTAPLVGNAIILSLNGDGSEPLHRVLRRGDANFAGPEDAGAVLIYEGGNPHVVDTGAIDGVTYFYKAYPWDGAAFVDDDVAPVQATPQTRYQPLGPEFETVVRSRIETGLKQEIARGLLRVKLVTRPGEPMATSIAVHRSPPLLDDTTWPVVSVQLMTDTPGDRGVGENVFGGEAFGGESWLAQQMLEIVAWTQNPDQRNELHRALRRILMANLPVLEALGITGIDIRLRQMNFLDNAGQFPVPVYTAVATVSASVPTGIVAANNAPLITDVDVIVDSVSVNLEGSA